jgi:ParB-like chromosome segregation protein Spo0J
MVSPKMVQSIERWPVDRLVAFANNARTHSDSQIGQVAASIAEFGFVNPILVGTDQVVIAGYARALVSCPSGSCDKCW